MKNKKILGGLVVVAVLLSGTTVLYFAGVERAGVTPATAVVPGGGGEPPKMAAAPTDCGAVGGFCAVDLGKDGGCNPSDCCPPGASWCPGWNYRKSMAFQEVGSPPPGSLGSCWTYNNSSPAPRCSEKWCDNAYFCSVYCVAANPSFVSTGTPPIPLNATCGLTWE